MEKELDAGDVGVYMVTDAVSGIIHAALDLGLKLDDVLYNIEMAINHVKTERKMLEQNICSQCERAFGRGKHK